MGKLVCFVLVGLGFNMDALVQGLMVCVFVWAKYLFQTRWAVFFLDFESVYKIWFEFGFSSFIV